MLGDINFNLEPKGIELILCKPNKDKIGNLLGVINPVYTGKFNDIDELTFSIPYNIFDNDFKLIKNPFWDYIKGDYLILLNNEKYFLIDLPESKLNDGKDIKDVKCYSYEYVLNDKKIRGYKTTAMLYDATENKTGVLNRLEEQTSWKIGYVDSLALMDTNGSHYRYRSFDVSEQTWLSFLNDIQTAYSCIFKYDTINKLVNVYATENVGIDTGLYISDSNYLTSFQKEEKFEDIVTQLNVYGKDNLSINNVNPLGTSYIEDFSFYMNNGYMTESLKSALNKYNTLLELHKDDFSNYLTQLTTLQSNVNTKEIEMTTLKEQLNVIENDIYIAINAGSQSVETLDLSTLHIKKNNKQSEINSKLIEINSVKSAINKINEDIKTLQNLISKKNNFTKEQLDELDFYIKQDTWQNDNIYYAEELLQEGKKALNKINQPTIEYSNVGVVDFLKIIEYQHDWNKLSLGDFVTINYEKFGADLTLRLVEYTHDFDGNKLTLSLSNKDIKDDALRYLGDVFSNNTQTSTAVVMNKYIWDLSEITNQQVFDIINNNLDASKNAVLSGVTQDVVVDGHGIRLSNMDNKNEQLRLLSNVIAFSEDGFAHANLAICSKGIVGESIFSKIIGSEKLLITNTEGKFTVDGSHMTAIDMDLTLNRSNGNSKIILNPEEGIKIQSIDGFGQWRDKFYADTEGNLVLDGKQTITYNGATLIENYKNFNGGLMRIFDINGNLNVKIGSENGAGDNIGGTIVLLKDCPNGANEDLFKRVALGILSASDEGIMQVLDTTGYATVTVRAGNTSTGEGSRIRMIDTNGITEISTNSITVAGEPLATQSWVANYVATHMPVIVVPTA